MNYSCEIIRDLIPLYIDRVCGDESGRAVEEHICVCEKCREYYNNMNENDGFGERAYAEKMKMVDSLKKVKSKINKKIRNIGIGAVVAVAIIAVVLQTLFSVPLRKVDKSEVSVTAEVYPLDELPCSVETETSSDSSVEFSFGENDKRNICKVEIPSKFDMDISVSENVMKENGYVTVINMNSKYFLREILQEIEGDTLYISAFKTTVFGGNAEKYQMPMTSIEFREINEIVYREKDGAETVLWKR